MTSSPSLDLHSLQSLTNSLRKNARFRGDSTIGHTWLKLVSPGRTIECGHTGNEGIDVESYQKGLERSLGESGPNPVAYLWEPLNDGSMQPGSGGFTPTLAAARSITPDEFDRVAKYIESYDFRSYALRGPQCTTFVLGALACIGLYYDGMRQIPVTQYQTFEGRRIRFWSDPRYSRLDIPMPHVLEERLREAIARGEFSDVTRWHVERSPSAASRHSE